MTKLTDDEVAKINEEQQTLAVAVAKQCAEQVQLLSDEIAADDNLPSYWAVFLEQILQRNGFTISLCRITNIDGRPVVQLSYNIDDDLYAYLQQPPEKLPVRLHGFLTGGITLESKDTAIDLAPQTGKTKSR